MLFLGLGRRAALCPRREPKGAAPFLWAVLNLRLLIGGSMSCDYRYILKYSIELLGWLALGFCAVVSLISMIGYSIYDYIMLVM